MIARKFKLWRSAGIVALASAAACSPPAEAPKAHAPAASVGEAGESPGGEGGEAGAGAAYAGLTGDARAAMRLQHLKGFVLIAERLAQDGQKPEAAALVGQGLLEAYEPGKADAPGFDPASLQTAANAEPAAFDRSIRQGLTAIDRARPASFNHADIAARMVDLAAALYGQAMQQDIADPLEYQHALGAALGARDALVSGRSALRARNAAAYDESVRELDRFVALWPANTAPEHPTPYGQLLVQSSRVRLALAPMLNGEEE